MPSDTVRLVVEGREFMGWTEVMIDMAIDQLADVFQVTLPYDPARADLARSFRPFGYQAVQLYIDDDLLLTGRIEKVSPSMGTDGRVLTVEGRSLPGVLEDCTIDGELETSVPLSLSTIARQICSPFGIQVRADNDTDPILDLTRAEYGQTAGDFLRSLAGPRNLFLNSAYDGKLVISWARSLIDRPPVAALVEGEPPLVSVEASFDATRRFSTHRIATQFAGDEDITGTAVDAGVTIYRPRHAASSDVDKDPAVTACRSRTASIGAAVSVSATVTGWRRPDGKRWAERQMVTLRAPGAMLPNERKWIIAGITLRLTTAGKTSSMRLAMPEVYAGDPPSVIPWEIGGSVAPMIPRPLAVAS